MNISSAILDMYKISEMNISEYMEFLEGNGKSKKHRIKLQTNKNGILVQNLKNAKTFMLGCVKEYYSPTDYKTTTTTCTDCKKMMGIYKEDETLSCIDCHRKCFDRYNNRQLNRIINK